MPKAAEIKYGFWIGLGVAAAFLVIAWLQAMTLRAVSRDA